VILVRFRQGRRLCGDGVPQPI